MRWYIVYWRNKNLRIYAQFAQGRSGPDLNCLKYLDKKNGSGAASMLARLRCRTGNVTWYIVTLPVTERGTSRDGGHVFLLLLVTLPVTGDTTMYIFLSPVTQRRTPLCHR